MHIRFIFLCTLKGFVTSISDEAADGFPLSKLRMSSGNMFYNQPEEETGPYYVIMSDEISRVGYLAGWHLNNFWQLTVLGIELRVV